MRKKYTAQINVLDWIGREHDRMQMLLILSSLLSLTVLSGVISQATFLTTFLGTDLTTESAQRAPASEVKKSHQTFRVGTQSTLQLLSCQSEKSHPLDLHCEVIRDAKVKNSLSLSSGSKIVVFDVSHDDKLGDLIQISPSSSTVSKSSVSTAGDFSGRHWVRASDLYFADLKESGTVSSD